MSRSIAILQSNYIPWKGYFDIIAAVDCFVFLDTVQYTKNDWRNRNKIKTSDGVQWLSVPVLTKGRFGQSIAEVEINNSIRWQRKHLQSLELAYSKAKFFEDFAFLLREFYQEKTWKHLSVLNKSFIKSILDYLRIETEIIDSEQLHIQLDEGDPNFQTQRLIQICQSLEADTYLSGPAARNYLNQELFQSNSIKLDFIDYSKYPVYEQLHGEFEHAVSILDLLFHCGPDSREYVRRLG